MFQYVSLELLVLQPFLKHRHHQLRDALYILISERLVYIKLFTCTQQYNTKQV